MDAERAVKEKQRLIRDEEMTGKISLEKRNKELVTLATENLKCEADAKAYSLTVTMQALGGVDTKVLQALASIDMNPSQLVALAFRDLADTSALYQIQIGQQQEQQSSSGIIVSTGLGSTAWFKSLVIGATAITQALIMEGELVDSVTGRVSPEQTIDSSYPWDANYLHFTVREPFPSSHSTTQLVFGKITAKQPMSLVSQMPENGVIFSDGIENDFLEFNAGTQAMISLAEKRGYLVV